jgi:hypothetical protein
MNLIRRLSLLMLVIAFATGAYAQPVAQDASYDEMTNILTINFDSAVKTGVEDVVIDGLIVDDDNGGINGDYQIRGGLIVNSSATGTSVQIRPIFDGVVENYTYTDPDGVVEARSCWGTDYADVRAIEGQLTHDTMRLYLPDGFACDAASGVWTAGTWVDMAYVPTAAGEQVLLTVVQYNANTNVMRFEFNKTMQFDQLAEDIATRDPNYPSWFAPGNNIMDNARGEDRNGNATLEYEENVRLSSITFMDGNGSEFTPSVALDITMMDSTVLEMELAQSNQFALEAIDLSTLVVTFGLYTFVDVDYNSVQPVTERAVTVVNEADPLELVSASYDMGENTYTAMFDQPLNPNINSYAVVPKFQVALADDSDDGVYLSRADKGLANNDSSAVFTLGVTDAQAVEEYLMANSGSAFNAKVGNNAVINILNNGNRVGVVPLTIIDETDRNKGPALDPEIAPIYDAATNLLQVAFDIRLDQTIEATGFYFIAGEDTIRLTGGETDRSGGNKVVDIVLNDVDQQMLESYADEAALRLYVAPYSVLQQSKLNGNLLVDGVEFTYTADANTPLVDYLWFDSLNGRLMVGATTTISPANVDLTKLSISGVTFSAPDSLVSYSPKQIWCYLNEADITAIQAFDDATKIALTASFQAGFIANEDGVANVEAVDVLDKTDITNGVETASVLVGCGRPFMIQSREAFPTPAREVFASIRSISDHANWYVANDQWTPYSTNNDVIPFTAAELDTVIEFFENRAIKDTTKGVYDMITELYAGDEVEYVPEKVDFLFADIYGEYKLGRNDTNAAFWEHGYFDSNDLPGSETENSNQANLVIVDSYPQSYITTEVAWFYDEDDEEWDEIAAGSAPTNGLPALANLYSRFVQYFIDPYEEQWVIEGLAYLSEFLVAGPPEFYGGGITTGFSGGNILTFIGSIQKNRVDVIHTYMFFLYLWEKYGEDDVIYEIATSHQVGMEGINNVIQNRQGELDAWVQGKSVLDIYSDFAVANMLDISIAGDNGIYQFDNINIGNTIRGTQLKWKASPERSRPPYSASDTEWTFSYNYTAYGPYDPNVMIAPETDQLMFAAGGDIDQLRLTKLNVKALATAPNIGDSYQMQVVELDETGSGGVPMSGHATDPAWTFGPFQLNDTTVVYNDATHFSTWIVVSVSGETGHTFKMTNESGDDYYSGMFAVQNPVLKRKFDVYVVSEKPIYNADGVEAPILTATDADGNVVQTLNTADAFSTFEVDNEGVGFTQYTASIWMAEAGTYTWALAGFYSNGLPLNNAAPMAFTYGQLYGGRNSYVSMGDEFQIRTSASSLQQGQDIGIIRYAADIPEEMSLLRSADVDESLVSISPIYRINADVRELNDPATITLQYDVAAAGDRQIAIFMENDGEWVNIGGTVNAEDGTITTRTGKLGSVRAVAGDVGQADAAFLVPSRFALNPNYPNPFNPSTTISMELPVTGHVSLIVYDILGREVAKLVNGNMGFGVHRVQWDGRSSSGSPLASGVYFARMSAGGYNAIQKMVLVK